MKNRKVANMLLLNYVLLFMVITFIFIGATTLINFGINHFVKSKPLTNLSAGQIMKDDYKQINYSKVIEYGGGVEIIDKNYNVIFSRGLIPYENTKLNKEEYIKFLVDSGKSTNNYYSIAYNVKKDFLLVVAFPRKGAFYQEIMINANGMPVRVYGSILLIISIFVVYVLTLVISLIIYSRLTSKNFVTPLRKLLDGVTRIARGDYSARVQLKSKNEFGELKDAFNLMAEKIELEKKLREASEENRKRLILDVSHDLKNPLSSIMGYSDFLINNDDLVLEERNKYLKIIYNNSNRSNSLIGDLFQLSKMESPEFQLELFSIDICEYLRQFIALNIPQLDGAGFIYDFDIPEEKIFVELDEKQMDRAVANIINNAIKYNKPGTEVKVNVKNHNNNIELVIEDNGKGIPKEMAKEIFEPFVRVDSSRNSETGGTGLGLAITKAIINKHKGSIELITDVNKGCKYIIKLRN